MVKESQSVEGCQSVKYSQKQWHCYTHPFTAFAATLGQLHKRLKICMVMPKGTKLLIACPSSTPPPWILALRALPLALLVLKLVKSSIVHRSKGKAPSSQPVLALTACCTAVKPIFS